MPAKFQLVSEFEPAGDQPRAIAQLIAGYREGRPAQTLLGATGTELEGLLLAAGALVAAGGVLLLGTRRRRTSVR